MKKLTLLLSIAALAAACTNSPQPVQQNSNASRAANTGEKPQTAIAHTTENQKPQMPPAATGGSKWSQSGDPIDTKKFDAAISSAEKALAGNPTDAAAKKALATAYFERGVALTDARQYASALGDYRKTIKYDPTNAEAKDWIDKIVMIYDSMGKSYPKEGEEPPPLPFGKEK